LGEMATALEQVVLRFSSVSVAGKMGAAQLAVALQVTRGGFGSAAEIGPG